MVSVKTKSKDCVVKSISFERRVLEEVESKVTNVSQAVNDATKLYFNIGEETDSIRKELAIELNKLSLENEKITKRMEEIRELLSTKKRNEDKHAEEQNP
jgi:energy-coupling factor transporter ATP-binding protein EcfA2